jgi:prepilin-type processing-associated H-X9-DG protein
VWWGYRGVTNITTGTIWQYTGRSLDVYLCPSFNRKEITGTVAPDGTTFKHEENPVVRSYTMNKLADGDRVWIGNIDNASRTLLFADSHTSEQDKIDGKRVCRWGLKDKPADYWRAWDGMLEGEPYLNQPYPYEAVGQYHQGRANAIFVDGHIESITWYDTTNACAGKW